MLYKITFEKVTAPNATEIATAYFYTIDADVETAFLIKNGSCAAVLSVEANTKSGEAYADLLVEVDCKFGAPMGRNDIGKKPVDKRVFCRRIRLDNGGYDKGGAYWGTGAPLYVQYTADLSYCKFFRSEK